MTLNCILNLPYGLSHAHWCSASPWQCHHVLYQLLNSAFVILHWRTIIVGHNTELGERTLCRYRHKELTIRKCFKWPFWKYCSTSNGESVWCIWKDRHMYCNHLPNPWLIVYTIRHRRDYCWIAIPLIGSNSFSLLVLTLVYDTMYMDNVRVH